MIIGVNGKIGSGKDTVGKIIQWLTKPEPDGQYIGFQTYDDFTLEKLSPFKIKKFAGKLKTIASLITGVPVEMFEDQEFKQKNMSPEWGMTYRTFLQKLGTEAMRDGLHTNVWCNALFADYKSKRELLQVDGTWIESDTGEVDFAVSIKYPKWIITDMRFPNEMEAIVEKGGITIRVMRPVHVLSQENHCGILHPSEIALDDAKFDYEIINDGTLEDLVKKVKEILIKENII
jgi:hypothetical protein